MKPRHYILLAVIAVLAIWNVWRMRQHHEAVATGNALTTGSPWSLYDHAAALRDDSSGQFTQALASFNTRLDHPDPSLSAAQLQDLQGCRIWLQYYRHAGAATAAPGSDKPADWNKLAREHVDSCVANHRDIAK